MTELILQDFGFPLYFEVTENEQDIVLTDASAVTFIAVGGNTNERITGEADYDAEVEMWTYTIAEGDFREKDVYAVSLQYDFLTTRSVTATFGTISVQ